MGLPNTRPPSLQEHEGIEKQPASEVKNVTTASPALAAAISEQKPSLWSPSMRRLYLVMFAGYLCSTIHGFDGSLMGAINAMKPFQKSFGLTGAGSSTGIVFIIYNIGQIAAFPFCSWIADGYGRRACIIAGCAIILVGTAVQSTAHNLGQFMGGRFILGFGAIIAHAASPVYTLELSHPAYRAMTAGMYNNFWWVGNILAGWVTYGSNLHFKNEWAWRIPTIMQAGFPTIAMIAMMFLPESPRWLIANDRAEEALAIFAKYHGEGDVNAPLVQLEYKEVLEDYQAQDAKGRWWDYRELFRNKQARYRIALVICVSFFGQWSGNNVVSYFMPEMVKTAGIHDPSTQLLLNAINPIFSWIAAMAGTTILDKFGRRKMMMSGLVGAMISYCFITAFTAETKNHAALSYGVIVFIYMFGICYAAGMIPSMTLYPMECLENRTRAKGAAVKFVFINIATMTNTYGISVGLKEIGWRLYLVYIVWICIEIAIIYFFFVETSGKTLEELMEIFEAKNPRKASTKKVSVGIDQDGHVYEMEKSKVDA